MSLLEKILRCPARSPQVLYGTGEVLSRLPEDPAWGTGFLRLADAGSEIASEYICRNRVKIQRFCLSR